MQLSGLGTRTRPVPQGFARFFTWPCSPSPRAPFQGEVWDVTQGERKILVCEGVLTQSGVPLRFVSGSVSNRVCLWGWRTSGLEYTLYPWYPVFTRLLRGSGSGVKGVDMLLPGKKVPRFSVCKRTLPT